MSPNPLSPRRKIATQHLAPSRYADPDAYDRWTDAKHQVDLWDHKLNTTEEMLRDKHGDEPVDKAIAKFKTMVAADPALFRQFQGQNNPYKWMFAQVQRAEAAETIGPDPTAWQTAERERIRVEVMAELNQAPAAEAPQNVTRIPTSLGTARSAAPRGTAPVVAVAEEFDDILSQFRKKA